MSEFMIHRKTLRQCGGYLEHAVKRRTTEQFSGEDIINVLEELTTRTIIGSSRVNLETRFNTLWKYSVDKSPKGNSNNMKYKSSDVIIKCHILQRSTHLANKCLKRGKINEVYIEKEPHAKKMITYPPLLKRPAYPGSPNSREALDIHIKEPLELGVIRKAGRNEEVQIPTPVLVAWHDGKSRMVWNTKALNTYTVPDRYPIPNIQIALTKIS
ncbi:hypothetical protein O181_027221 [Austropuccinia psidii MF-1]|uniref:Uncharacterized protein n=1 Tax=Austropuccinia psidii MF-1 TaxID=1389203 RepID=A0A9Q3CS32_9BASI|nr:hypothetical protein [Austropuccinia psidii MF-1]